MEQAFRKAAIALTEENKTKMRSIREIISSYATAGLKLSLRQLYYQLVSVNAIANSEKEYAKLSHMVVEMRMGGVLDWDAIEDRIRVPSLPYSAESISEAIRDVQRQYRRNRMLGQENYIEAWCEKDALSGILKQIVGPLHITLMINRGYSSCSAMYEAAQRLLAAQGLGQELKVLYVGDHDPSGLDMVRDIEDRMIEFGVTNLEVQHVALTDEQVEKYAPPPNPSKVTDPRAKNYIEKYGYECWEVDALKPEVLSEIVKKQIAPLIDADQFQKIMKLEMKDRDRLAIIADNEMIPVPKPARRKS